MGALRLKAKAAKVGVEDDSATLSTWSVATASTISEAPAPAAPEAEAPASYACAPAPAPGPAPAIEPSSLEKLREKWHAIYERAADNAVNRWYKKCKKHGAFILLSPPNQARCVQARTLKLAKARWSPASERIFKYLHLAPCEVDVLYSLFRTADADNSNTLAVGELMEFLDLKHSDFANRVFCMLEYMRGWHVSGSCDFEAYVVSVWNICTLDTDEFRDFVFELYDADESGYLDREEALDLVVDITTEAFAGTERSALLLQDLVTLIAESPLEAISKEDFKEFTASRPALLGPGYQLRQRMRLKFGGEAFWDYISGRRKVQGGVAAVDEAGQISSTFVPLRRLLLDYDESRSEPPMVHERNHDQENIRHRIRKRKLQIIEKIISQRSMSMCTTVVRQNKQNPLMAEFLHERRIGLEMLDEMEEMRRDVEEGAFQLPAAFRDDVELTSNMMRLKSMESERKFRDKERSKLVKWIGYSDHFEKIYDDPDFSTIKEKARERQALKDLENTGNPEIARQLEAKRKAEEEALHRARTSSAALARAAKARWAQVQERMAATADRKQEARTAKLAQIAELARQKELEASSSSEYESGSEEEEESGEEESSGDEATGEDGSAADEEASQDASAEDGALEDIEEGEESEDEVSALEDEGAPRIVDD